MPRARVVVAALIIDASIEAKIKEKHNLTPIEVREAVMLDPQVRAEWQDDERNGRRLAVWGTTRANRPVIAYLVPVNWNDPDEGTYKLKTALSRPG